MTIKLVDAESEKEKSSHILPMKLFNLFEKWPLNERWRYALRQWCNYSLADDYEESLSTVYLN